MTRATWWITAAVIAAAAVCAAMVVWREPRDPLARLARAANKLDTRVTEARLSGFAYRPHSSHPPVRDTAHLHFRALAAEVLQSTSHDDHAAGVAALLLGANDDAVKRLTACAETHPNDASVWNDLAAARYTAANANDDPQQLVAALAAADHALRVASPPEATFNRGLILDHLGLSRQAAESYDKYLRTDSISGWAKAAKDRKSALHITTRVELWTNGRKRIEEAVEANDFATVLQIVNAFRQDARSWGEAVFLSEWAEKTLAHDPGSAVRRLAVAESIGRALKELSGEALLWDACRVVETTTNPQAIEALARGQAAYANGRRNYTKRDIESSRRDFRQATTLLKKVHSPVAYVADYYYASCFYDLGSNAEAGAALRDLLASIPTHYFALRAQLLWETASVTARTGALSDTLSSQQQSLDLFEQLGEYDNATRMMSAIAAGYSFLGRQAEAWRVRARMFRRTSASGEPALQQIALDLAARTEALGGHLENSESLMGLALDPNLRQNPRITANSFFWHALIAHKLGDDDSAMLDLSQAKQTAIAIADRTLSSQAAAEILFAEGVVTKNRNPQQSLQLMDQYIGWAVRSNDTFLLPEAHVERAGTRRAMGDPLAAIADLKEAMRLLDTRRGGSADEYRDAYFATSDRAVKEAVDLYALLGDDDSAFKTMEHSRNSIFIGGPVPDADSPQEIASRLPSGVAVVSYVFLKDCLLSFTLSSNRFLMTRTAVRPELFRASATALNVAVATNDQKQITLLAERLSGWLIGPIDQTVGSCRTLIVIPDRELMTVPFALLSRPSTNRRLLQELKVVFAPTALRIGEDRPSGRVRTQNVTIVGDPSFDSVAYPFLPRLSSAAAEASEVGRLYPAATVLIGSEATKEGLVSRLADSNVVDLAAHAIIGSSPRQSYLLLASFRGDSGMLSFDEIGHISMPNLDIALVAGCRTDLPVTDGASDSTLAVMFLRSGAGNVVGTLGPVDDEAARRFSVMFHSEILSGADPPEALRRVQAAMATSADPRLQKPSAWAGFRCWSSRR